MLASFHLESPCSRRTLSARRDITAYGSQTMPCGRAQHRNADTACPYLALLKLTVPAPG